jgi:hypothetical protein
MHVHQLVHFAHLLSQDSGGTLQLADGTSMNVRSSPLGVRLSCQRAGLQLELVSRRGTGEASWRVKDTAGQLVGPASDEPVLALAIEQMREVDQLLRECVGARIQEVRSRVDATQLRASVHAGPPELSPIGDAVAAYDLNAPPDSPEPGLTA